MVKVMKFKWQFGALVVALLATALGHAPPASAQDCTADQLAAAVDNAGARLRDLTRTNQPRIEAKIKTLAVKRGWPEAEAQEQALSAITDARMDELDRTANELLAKIDQLGALPAGAVPECGRIQDIEASGLELQAAVRAKSAYVVTRLDALIGDAPKPVDVATPRTPAAVAMGNPPAPPPAPKAPTKAPEPSWSTTTKADAQPAPMPTLNPAPTPPPTAAVVDDGYELDEIVRASSGFFGQVSANIAAVVEKSFSATGKPTGYILGTEGGGAFLAGLRYGQGTLYLRAGGTVPVYWHGPSVGLDFGAAGSKVMFLVYRLREPDQLMPTFSALEGSAYVAGGLGVTLMSNGQVQMAPIRAGLGLRLGASVGYVRFTRRPTWNPF